MIFITRIISYFKLLKSQLHCVNTGYSISRGTLFIISDSTEPNLYTLEPEFIGKHKDGGFKVL